MCSFKPGDEVVCVTAAEACVCEVGATYTVKEIFWHRRENRAAVILEGVPNTGLKADGTRWRGRRADRFRKVERKNDSLSIDAFLTIKPGFEEPKRTPVKKRERV